MTLVSPVTLSSNMPVGDGCGVSACSPTRSVYKSSDPCLVGVGGVAFGQLSAKFLSIPVARSEIEKLSFHEPVLFIGF